MNDEQQMEDAAWERMEHLMLWMMDAEEADDTKSLAKEREAAWALSNEENDFPF